MAGSGDCPPLTTVFLGGEEDVNSARFLLAMLDVFDNPVQVEIETGPHAVTDRLDFFGWIRNHHKSPGVVRVCK